MKNRFKRLLMCFVALFCLIAIGCSGACALLCIKKRWEVSELIKTVMTVKLILIPAHLFILVVGFYIMIFAVVLIFFAYMAMLSTSVAGAVAYLTLYKQNRLACLKG